MKLLLSASLLCQLLIPMPKEEGLMKEVYGSYCVMNMHDNSILNSEKQDYTQSVASISKIMTAIVAIEKGNLADVVTVSDVIDQVDGSMLYVQKGDSFLLEDLLYGLMLRSGNDAAVLIGDHVGDGLENFVKMMNEKAAEIGMVSTLFRNPSGLDERDGGNISSSCDMARLMSYAMKNAAFRKIVSAKTYIPRKGILWKNKNKFLFEYPDATGGKTGYTKNSKRTLVTSSKRDNMEIVVVTFNVSNDFQEHEAAHEWAYANFSEVTLLKKGIYHYKNQFVTIQEPFVQTIEKGNEEKVEVETEWGKKQFSITSSYKDFANHKKYEVEYE